MKKSLIGFFFLTFIFINTASSSITKYFGSSKINLDETGIINFIRYLEGRFYSEGNILNRAAEMSPMYYAISEDGKIGYGYFCASYRSDDCSDDFGAFKTVEYCKAYTKQNCAIFAYRNEIVWRNINLVVKDLSFQSNLDLFKKLGLFNNESKKLDKRVNEKNYHYYISQTIDRCISRKELASHSDLRGADLDCLIPGIYEISINQKGNGYD
jgi:hypothetical protein